MEITSEEQNKVKRIKRTEDSLRHLWDNIKWPTFNYRCPRRREKENVWEMFWRDYSWKFLQHGKGNNQLSSRSSKSSIQDKSKEKHTETHINQTKKD